MHTHIHTQLDRGQAVLGVGVPLRLGDGMWGVKRPFLLSFPLLK